jgi:hypothetical protein
MKRTIIVFILLIFSATLVSCAHYPPDRYNTQKGALFGAGAGALLGQAIGGNTAGTLIGLTAGTIIGGLVGNAVDQDYQAARDAARYDRPVVYYDERGAAVQAIPRHVTGKPNCRVVTKRVWQDGTLVSETVEEICTEPEVVVVGPRYAYPPYPRVYFHYYQGPRGFYYRGHPRYYHPWW